MAGVALRSRLGGEGLSNFNLHRFSRDKGQQMGAFVKLRFPGVCLLTRGWRSLGRGVGEWGARGRGAGGGSGEPTLSGLEARQSHSLSFGQSIRLWASSWSEGRAAPLLLVEMQVP